MNSRRQLNEEEISKIGLRLKSCRVLTGLTQEQFADEFKFPYTTIRNWEYGGVIPRRNGLDDFVACLRNRGVYVDCDWILFGYGAGPSFDLKNPDLEEIKSPNVDTFKTQSKAKGLNPIITIVKDNAMAPWFCKGDLLGGTLIDASGLLDFIKIKLCNGNYPMLVRLDDGYFAPRWPKIMNDKIAFISQNALIDEPNPISAALITWHEVKYPR